MGENFNSGKDENINLTILNEINKAAKDGNGFYLVCFEKKSWRREYERKFNFSIHRIWQNY